MSNHRTTAKIAVLFGVVLAAMLLPARDALADATAKLAVVAKAKATAARPDDDREPEAAPGEGRELFVARCSVCHSIDYVQMHSRFATRALWEGSVAKMRNAYKAPMSDDEARQILDYLERQYAQAR